MRSKNKYDVYRWIEKVIDSCKTHEQFSSVNNLIQNFVTIYEDYDLAGELRRKNSSAKFAKFDIKYEC